MLDLEVSSQNEALDVEIVKPQVAEHMTEKQTINPRGSRHCLRVTNGGREHFRPANVNIRVTTRYIYVIMLLTSDAGIARLEFLHHSTVCWLLLEIGMCFAGRTRYPSSQIGTSWHDPHTWRSMMTKDLIPTYDLTPRYLRNAAKEIGDYETGHKCHWNGKIIYRILIL